MFQTKVFTESMPWVPLDYPGVFIRMVHTSQRLGSMTVLIRVDPGVTFPAHLHMRADETVFVISGDFVEDGQTYGPGSFFAGGAGTPHGPHSSCTGCVLLTTFSAALDFQSV